MFFEPTAADSLQTASSFPLCGFQFFWFLVLMLLFEKGFASSW